MFKKLVFLSLFLIIHLHAYSQNACSNCSEYSLSENWSKLLDCLDSEIKKTDHHFDFLCRANLYGVIFENADSVLFQSKFIKKEEFQKLALDDLDIVIQKQPTFAVTYNIRAAVKKVMGIDYCEDLKMFCNLTQNCEEYEKKCGDESKK